HQHTLEERSQARLRERSGLQVRAERGRACRREDDPAVYGGEEDVVPAGDVLEVRQERAERAAGLVGLADRRGAGGALERLADGRSPRQGGGGPQALVDRSLEMAGMALVDLGA